MGDPEFWNNQEKARATNSRISSLKKKLGAFQKLNGRYDDLMAGIELAREFDDDSAAADAFAQAAELDADIASFELITLLDKPGDMASCYLIIQAGAGGTEACDWAQMLYRMYQRWAERKGFTCETVDWQDGDGAGLRGATMKITGDYAYGYLKNERGVHRLVRISPFDSAGKRHTSF